MRGRVPTPLPAPRGGHWPGRVRPSFLANRKPRRPREAGPGEQPGRAGEDAKGPARTGGVAGAGSCAQAGLRRGKELRGADRAAPGAALAGARVGGREEARGERAASGSASVAARSAPR